MLCGPAGQLVPAGAFAQQPGQLGHVRFFDPAPRVRAATVRAGVIGAAFPDLAVVADGDLPGVRGHGGDGGALALVQFPADGAGQLVTGPGGELVQAGDQPVTGPAPSAVTISRRRYFSGSAAIPSSSTRR